MAFVAGWAGPERRAAAALARAPALSVQESGDRLLPIAPTARFKRITTADGLSDAAVLDILQDRFGFMWFASANGLTRYDGYSFIVYRHDPTDPSSLSSDRVQALLEDRNGELWVGTADGLNRLDRATGTFERHLATYSVLSLHEDDAGLFWVGTTLRGVTFFDPANPIPYSFITGSVGDADDAKRLSGGMVHAIYQDQAGEIWLATDAGSMGYRGGLDRYEPATETFAHYLSSPNDPASLGGERVLAVYQDRQGTLWVGIDGGLNRLERPAGTFVRYAHDPGDPDSLGGEVVRAVAEDHDGRLWVGTDRGLDLLDREQGRFVHYRYDPHDPLSLVNDLVYTIYEDRSGVLWIGTNGGVSRYDETASQFALYRHDPDDPLSLSDSQVMAVLEDRLGVLWVGTAQGGLNRLDREAGTVTVYRHDAADPGSLSDDAVLALYEDRAGRLWVGTGARWLDRFDPETGTFEHVEYLSAGSARAIAEDRSGRLWLGTEYGLYRHDPVMGTLDYFHTSFESPSLSHDVTTFVGESVEGVLLVATAGGGINIWDPGEEQFGVVGHDPTDPNSLGHNTVYALYQEPSGSPVWVGTWAGLDRVDDQTGEWTHYTQRDGLPDGPVIAVLPDEAGNLWVGTEWGLSRFDPRSETFRNLDVRDGLQPGRFNWTAHFRSRSGEMFFGGAEGLTAFHPERIPANPLPPPVVVTTFRLFNEVVATDLPADERIELAHDQNFLSFEFAALDYADPAKNQYAYRMEGVDNDWVQAGTRRYADYRGLQSGHYIFRVKGTNKDGVWNETGAQVYITITPPFWQRGWFRGLVVLVLLGGGLGTFRLRVRSLERRSRTLESQVAERTAALEQELERRLTLERALRHSEAERAVTEERNRLARDLHDSVTQSLYSLTLLAEAGQRAARDGDLGRVREYQLRMGEIGQQSLGEMRLLVHELRPPALESMGLAGALRQRLEAVEERVGIEVRLVLEGQAGRTELPAAVEEELFRIGLEALNNALRHASPTLVEVRLLVDEVPLPAEQGEAGKRVELAVVDDGTGFDVDRGLAEGGLGLESMYERAGLLGARLEITSAPGDGTRVLVSLLLPGGG